MKKLIAIFLLLQFASNNSFAEEVIKLPRLFTHYYHHSHEHQDTKDFADFLAQHYSDKHEQNDHHEDGDDCNLPFKHCDGCCVNVHAPAVAFIPSFEETDFVFSIALTRKYSFENEKIKSICSPPIWQPPKVS